MLYPLSYEGGTSPAIVSGTRLAVRIGWRVPPAADQAKASVVVGAGVVLVVVGSGAWVVLVVVVNVGVVLVVLVVVVNVGVVLVVLVVVVNVGVVLVVLVVVVNPGVVLVVLVVVVNVGVVLVVVGGTVVVAPHTPSVSPCARWSATALGLTMIVLPRWQSATLAAAAAGPAATAEPIVSTVGASTAAARTERRGRASVSWRSPAASRSCRPRANASGDNPFGDPAAFS